MTRRRAQESADEPLFEEWWLEDQRLFQDSVTRKSAASGTGQRRRGPARRAARGA